MKFKLDAHLPVELVMDLRGFGHDADAVTGEGLRGAADSAVVDAAFAADRILFTLDKGIANIQRYPIHQHAGIVLFRPDTSGRGSVIAFVRERLRTVATRCALRLESFASAGGRFGPWDEAA